MVDLWFQIANILVLGDELVIPWKSLTVNRSMFFEPATQHSGVNIKTICRRSLADKLRVRHAPWIAKPMNVFRVRWSCLAELISTELAQLFGLLLDLDARRLHQ